jgi:hypothetical protein
MRGLDPRIPNNTAQARSTAARFDGGGAVGRVKPPGITVMLCRGTYVQQGRAFSVMPGPDPGIPAGTVETGSS